jgi:hypothetical protein
VDGPERFAVSQDRRQGPARVFARACLILWTLRSGGGRPHPPGVLLLNVYFSLSRAAWIPCVIAWDPENGEFRRVEGPESFTTWEEADEASRGGARGAHVSRGRYITGQRIYVDGGLHRGY